MNGGLQSHMGSTRYLFPAKLIDKSHIY